EDRRFTSLDGSNEKPRWHRPARSPSVSRSLRPARLREHERLRALLVRRIETDNLAVLPLADRPRIGVQLLLVLDVAPDGLEVVGGDHVADLLAVDFADLLDRLLGHFEAGRDAYRAGLRLVLQK